jgi:hypothetical protein
MIFLSMGIVQACSCLQPGTPTDEMARADAVFSGKVTEIIRPSHVQFYGPVKVQFEVSEEWKGNLTRRLMIVTAIDSAGCGYEFEKGRNIWSMPTRIRKAVA